MAFRMDTRPEASTVEEPANAPTLQQNSLEAAIEGDEIKKM